MAGALAGKLKAHQWEGVRFMWKNLVDDVTGEDDEGGCILAHDMGLGKTLQTLTFLHTFLFHHRQVRPPDLVKLIKCG